MLRLIYKKKAQGTTPLMIFVLLELVIVAAAFGILFLDVRDKVGEITFEKNYLARNVALLTDTVYAAPINVFADYSKSWKVSMSA